MIRTCLKCAHSNADAGTDALAACPQCGAIYSRVEAAVARERLGDVGAAKKSRRPISTKPPRSVWSRAKLWFAVVMGIYLLAVVFIAVMDPPPEIPSAVVASEPKRKARVIEAPAKPIACSDDDAQCIGKRELSSAALPCQRAVEAQLAYRHEWQDSWLEEKFERVMWYEPTTTIAYYGSKLQAQNGFGAWKNLSYFCVWNVAGGRVVKAGLNE